MKKIIFFISVLSVLNVNAQVKAEKVSVNDTIYIVGKKEFMQNMFPNIVDSAKTSKNYIHIPDTDLYGILNEELTRILMKKACERNLSAIKEEK